MMQIFSKTEILHIDLINQNVSLLIENKLQAFRSEVTRRIFDPEKEGEI
jgi:hypothetical protein